MDSEAQDATQSSASSTPSSRVRPRIWRLFEQVAYQNRYALLKGVFLSLFIHTSAFYGIYVLSKKVFEVINSREKVFRFTLLKDIPGEKKTALAPTQKLKSNAGVHSNSKQGEIEEEPQVNEDKTSESGQETSVEGVDSNSSGMRDFPVSYPRMSRILGEEGEVVFLLESRGETLSFKKLKSSGFWRLDQAAEKVLLAKSENFLKETLNDNVERVRFVFKLNENQFM